MKKLLLSLIAVAGFTGLAYAETATFDFTTADAIKAMGYNAPASGAGTDLSATTPLTVGDVTITYDKGTSQAAAGGQMIRFYNGNSGYDLRTSSNAKVKDQKLTFKANGGTITSIAFTASKLALSASTGTLPALSGTTATWTGSAADVTFTTTGQITITKIVVSYAPSGKEAAGLSFETPAVSIVQGETYAGQTVKNPNNLTVTYASDDENVAEVNATTGAVTLGTEIGTATITASTDGDATHAAGTASYTITVVKGVANLAEFNALAKGDEALINCELTVTYCDGKSNAFVTDGTHYQLIFRQNANFTYKTGDVLNSGWKATMGNFNGLPEMEPVGDVPSVKEAGTYTPSEITADEITADNINRVVVLKNVEFAAATPAAKSAFTGKVGETTITFYNKFTVASAAAGKYYVTGVVGINNTNMQINPISFEAATTDAIDSITADDAAEAEYYNLQGVRVDAPESGLYIVRRGNKVTKELVK